MIDSHRNKIIEQYSFMRDNHTIKVTILKSKPVNQYHLSLLDVSPETERVINRIKEKVANEISFNLLALKKQQKEFFLEEQFKHHIKKHLEVGFGDLDKETLKRFTDHIVLMSLGLGDIEYLLKDAQLEEIVINGSKKYIWVFHKKYGWLKTNVIFMEEARIRHLSTLIARDVNKDFTLLKPLLDAHLKSGDRVNATLFPITSFGNTLTIRKFSADPWTITDFLTSGTMDLQVAAIIWQAIQYEESVFIVGGTGSGKTSTLNVLANFFPPNQRIISIEDTRELQLPDTLHWVAMETRQANPEGKGEVTILDCMINTLRMRPDRIVLGEVRRKKEVEIVFESIRTGHSGYATFHASTVNETINRLINPPINLPKMDLSALGLIVVQYRDRRTGMRRTFQVAELMETGEPNLLYQFDMEKQKVVKVNESIRMKKNLKIFAGLNDEKLQNDLNEKKIILKYLADNKIRELQQVGEIIAEYYNDKELLLKRLSDKA